MKLKATFLTLSLVTGLLLVSTLFGFYIYYYSRYEPNQTVEGLLWPNPKQINEFALVDQNGEVFTIDDLKGNWTILFFGYTYCPDVCPVTMALLNGVYNQLDTSDGTENVQTVFVTIDPDRDTVQRLNEYMEFFNDDFIGLGGTLAQIQGLTSQIGVVFMYGPETDEGEYLVDHTSSLFLLDPDVRLVSVISPPYSTESIVKRYQEISTFISRQNSP